MYSRENENVRSEIHKLKEELKHSRGLNIRLETEKHKEHEDLRQENEILRSKIFKLGEELQLSQRELHKERRGKVMDLTLGTSGDLSEDITNPCRESELKNRYEKLRQNLWAKLLFQLKKERSKELRKQAEQLIKDVLRQSQDYIQDVVNTMKHLSPSSQVDSSNTKATQYFDLSIQNLQMAIYHEKMGLYNTDKLQRVPEVLRPIVEECYKTGCLMALHNPPLLLDFNNCEQGPFPPIKTNQPCDAEEVDEKCSDPTVFIAIDLGTEFSGYYFRIAGSEDVWQPKWGEEYGFNTPKTPTCILFDENKEFLDFGYDARVTYTSQTQKDEAKKLYLFDNFKTELHGKELHRDSMLTARNGKQMRAMKVFSESLRFMKDHALEMIRKHTAGVKYSASDATWILTVPAIWSPAAKQFMREAATGAGLVTESESDRLIITLEHEAASVWCRQLLSEDLTEAEVMKEVPGTQYMVVDCGGVNINITVYEVIEGGHLKELNWATKTFEDGKPVDKHFKEYLRKNISEKMCDALEEKHPSDLQKLMYDYNGDMKFLFNLEQLVRKVEDKGASSRGSAETQGRIIQIGDKLKLLHDNRIRSIESLIREILADRKLNINYMFLVGGFALSPYVNSFIREKFWGRCKVLCPADAQMAVLRGAVTFGMRQNMVESRISRYSYGIRIVEEFDQTRHRDKRKYVTKEGKAYCNDCFHCLVQKYESVHFDEVREFNFTLIERDQKPVQFDLYCTESKSARFVDERGMVKIGSLTVSMPVIKEGNPRLLQLQVKVGCPEMQATVRDLNTGEIGSVKLDLMSK